MIHRRDRIAHGNFLRRWLEQHASRLQLEVQAEPPVQASEILWDCQDARLRRAGFLLASRPGPGEVELWTIPLPERADPGLGRIVVAESWAETPGGLPPPHGDAFRAILGHHSLQSILEAQAQFSPLHLVYHGQLLVRLTLEQWILRMRNSEPILLHAVETRTLEESDLDLAPFFQSMSTACAMIPAALVPEIDLLGAAGIAVEPELDLGPMSLDRTLSMSELGLRVLRRHFLQAWKNEPAARWGRDPEALHDFRVALRRMRAALRIFRDFLPARITALSVPLRTWMRATGEVRDLDVQLAQLTEWSTAIDPRDRAALNPLVRRLTDKRARAHARMLKVFASRRIERLIERTTQALRKGAGSRPAMGRLPVLLAAPELILERHRKLMKKGKRLTGSSSAEEFHQARIRGKKLRYAIEFLGDIYGDPAERALRNLVALQDLLGRHQDAVVASMRLRELIGASSSRLPHHTHFVIGMLAERYASLAETLRRETRRTFDSARGKKWKHLREALESGRISEIQHATHSLSSRHRHRPRRPRLPSGSGEVSHQGRRAPDPAGRVRIEGDEGQSGSDPHQPTLARGANGQNRRGRLGIEGL